MDLLIAIFGGDTVSVVLKLVLGVLVTGFSVWLIWWIEKNRNQQAHDDTQKDRNDEQSKVDDVLLPIFDDAKKSEDDIEKLIREREKNTGGS